MRKELLLRLFMISILLLSGAAHAVTAAMQNNIDKLRNSGNTGVVLQQKVMQRAAGIAPHNRPYVFDGVGDCYGYVRQVWNAILSNGSVHSEDFYPNAYNKSRWLGVTGGVPVADAVSPDWALFTNADQLLPGDILSTHQGHAWGSQWHGGLYAGKENGVHKQWDNAGSGGAYKRNIYSGFKYYYRPLHNLLAQPSVTGTPEYPGRYRLVARHSGKVADVQYGGTANGTNVWQWPVTGDRAQQWEINHAGDGYYNIRSVHSGFYLSATNGGTTDGTNVQMGDFNGTQCGALWKIEQVGDGYTRLVNKCSGKVLDVAGGPSATYDGANLQIWSVIGTNRNQMWKLESLPQTHRVIARHSGKALDVAFGGTADGTNVQQWSINDTNGGAAQRWDVKHEGEGYFSLRNRASGKFLDVRYSGTANGTNVWQWGLTPGSCAQLWRIVSVGDGYNRLANKCSGRVLDVLVGSGAMNDGANVQIWDYLGFDNQKWRFTPAN